jgi:predicted MFS family arabinose efflux permease
MKNVISSTGIIALMVAHCTGMVDMIAMPVWVGTLVEYFHFGAQQAGSVVTLFLLGSVLSSVILAPRLHKLNCRRVAITGFALAALFMIMPSFWSNYQMMLIWHLLAGISVGAALSMTHGTIACSHNPHRLFALVGTPMGVFGVVFLAAAPQIIARTSGHSLFLIFAGLMVIAAIVSSLIFPQLSTTHADAGIQTKPKPVGGKLPDYIWMGILGICCMAVVQSMTFSFLERVGDFRGFSFGAVSGVLIAIGLVNLFPAPLAAVMEKRMSVRFALAVGPVLQALLSLLITNSLAFPLYAVSSSIFVAIMIFTHTFAFGVLSRLDTSGRAMAATPAILMTGAAVGPVLGGTLVKVSGYGSIGLVSLFFGALALYFFSRIPSVADSSEKVSLT